MLWGFFPPNPARAGWMAPFPLLALLGALTFVGIILMLPKYGKPRADRTPLWVNFRSVLTYVPALAGLAVGLFASTANEVVNLIFGVWLPKAYSGGFIRPEDRCAGYGLGDHRHLGIGRRGIGGCLRGSARQAACHRHWPADQ